MAELSPEFRGVLDPLLTDLAMLLRSEPLTPRLDDRGHRVRVEEGVLWVPVRYEVHWRRFHTVPTDLLREAAYEAKRRTMRPFDEADCQVFAEAFLRDRVLASDR